MNDTLQGAGQGFLAESTEEVSSRNERLSFIGARLSMPKDWEASFNGARYGQHQQPSYDTKLRF